MTEASAFSTLSSSALTAVTGEADKLLHQATTASSENGKIDKSAKEFEAILLGSWLQQAEQSFASVPGGDDDADAGKEQYMSMAMQSLGTSMAGSGGVGIAKMIAAQLHKTDDHSPGHGPNPLTAGKK